MLVSCRNSLHLFAFFAFICYKLKDVPLLEAHYTAYSGEITENYITVSKKEKIEEIEN